MTRDLEFVIRVLATIVISMLSILLVGTFIDPGIGHVMTWEPPSRFLLLVGSVAISFLLVLVFD
jgi:hypothetical protein